MVDLSEKVMIKSRDIDMNISFTYVKPDYEVCLIKNYFECH